MIRQETKEDYPVVFKLIEEAFKNQIYSDHTEQFLVERLRKTTSFIPELSLVAVYDAQIVGHILLTRIKIHNSENSFDSLALAPVSVLPQYQGKGIGSKLICTAHQVAKNLDHKSIVLLGHDAYYPKFGYQKAHTFGITLPFDAPKENCMAIELVTDSLKNVNGMVAYPKEFTE